MPAPTSSEGHPARLLVGGAESFAAGGHNLFGRCRGRQDGLDQIGGGVQHVFAVSNTSSRHSALQGGGHALGYALAGLLGDAQHRGHRVGHRRRIGDGGQLEKPHPVRELVDQPPGHFQREAGLADPAHPGQRHQPMRLHRGLHLVEFGLTSDEAADRRPQIPRTGIQRPQRRKFRAQAVCSDLKHPDRSRHISQPSRSQISRSTPLSSPAVDSANRI